MDILNIIEGLIADVPEAMDLWQKIAPLVAVNASIPAAVIAEISALTPVAHAAVDVANASIAQAATP